MEKKDLIFAILFLLGFGYYSSRVLNIPLVTKVGEGLLFQSPNPNVLHQSLWEEAYTIKIAGKTCIMARPVWGSVCCEKYDPDPYTRHVDAGGGYYASGESPPASWDSFVCNAHYGCEIYLGTLRKIDVDQGSVEPERCCIDYKIFAPGGQLKESSNRCEGGIIKLQKGEKLVLSSIMCVYKVPLGHSLPYVDAWYVQFGKCALPWCSYGRTWGYFYNVYEHDIAFYAYVPGAPAGIIPGTRGCYYQDLLANKPQLKQQPPKTFADAFKPIGVRGESTDWSRLPLSASPGTCNLYVDHWDPSLGINFQWAESLGENQVCMVEGVRSAIRELTTVEAGGVCYAIPGDVIRTVDCCPGKNNCGQGFFCDPEQFKCVPQSIPGTIPCNSVWDCPNQGKETCRATMEGFELVSAWKCDYSKPQTIGGKTWAGTCVEVSKKEVECCPPDEGCSPGEYCSVTYGYTCRAVSPAPSACPYECCDERMVKTFNFKYKPCPPGYICYAGNCVTKPPVPPATCGNNKCEPYETPETCPQDCGKPIEINWFVVIAMLSSFGIGYVLPEILKLKLEKKSRIILGVSIGTSFALATYFFLTIPWWVYVIACVIIFIIWRLIERGKL